MTTKTHRTPMGTIKPDHSAFTLTIAPPAAPCINCGRVCYVLFLPLDLVDAADALQALHCDACELAAYREAVVTARREAAARHRDAQAEDDAQADDAGENAGSPLDLAVCPA